MSKRSIDKTPLKQQAWISRTATALGISEDEAVTLLRTPRYQGVRINPLRGNVDATLQELQQLGWQGKPYEWCANGYSIDSDPTVLRDSPAATEGRIFIQNPASWLPVLALNPHPGEAILDVCSAPGGKTSHIAAITENQADITANDNSRPRLAKLQANMRRLNANAADYTLFDATRLAQKLEGEQFDKILLDAPCSGEGLMQLDRSKDFATWSVAHVRRLQQLQKRILTQAWQLLKPDGTLVYSTCTMAPEENEAVVDYLLRTRTDAQLIPVEMNPGNRVPAVREWNGKTFTPLISDCMRLIPSESTEAFFVAVLRKSRSEA